jgi:hypothetical protein
MAVFERITPPALPPNMHSTSCCWRVPDHIPMSGNNDPQVKPLFDHAGSLRPMSLMVLVGFGVKALLRFRQLAPRANRTMSAERGVSPGDVRQFAGSTLNMTLRGSRQKSMDSDAIVLAGDIHGPGAERSVGEARQHVRQQTSHLRVSRGGFEDGTFSR